MNNLFLVRGIPGAGKTTFAESICDVVFSIDDHRVIDGEYKYDPEDTIRCVGECLRDVDKAMAHGFDIAVTNIFTRWVEMEEYYLLAADHDYRVFSLIVENRHEGKSNHGVPDHTLIAMNSRFEIKLR